MGQVCPRCPSGMSAHACPCETVLVLHLHFLIEERQDLGHFVQAVVHGTPNALDLMPFATQLQTATGAIKVKLPLTAWCAVLRLLPDAAVDPNEYLRRAARYLDSSIRHNVAFRFPQWALWLRDANAARLALRRRVT